MTAKKYNYEMIRFNMYSEKHFIFSKIPNNLTSLIYQPELRTYLIHGFGYESLVDGIISNKFIQRLAFLITINDINNYYLNQSMIYFEDGLINFALHFQVKSLYLMKKIGYYYFYNKKSVSHTVNKNKYINNFFFYLKYLLDNTKNTKIEKNMIFFLLNLYINDNNVLNNITENFEMYNKIFISLLKNKFITPKNKIKIINLKRIISKIQKKLKINNKI